MPCQSEVVSKSIASPARTPLPSRSGLLVRVSLLLAALLAAPGCFATRALGLGPDPDPDEIADGDTPEVIFEKGQRLFAAQRWSDAADVFHELWTEHPKSDLASDAQFYEAESRYGQGKYAGAFELYKRYLRAWPLSPHGPLIQRRIYDVGTYTIQAGQQGWIGIFNYADEGVEQLDYLVSAFPHGDLADDALIYMADYERQARRSKDAIVHLHDLIDNYPLSEWWLEARLRLAKAYRDVNRGTKYDADALRRSVAEYRAYIELVGADRARAREYSEQIALARAELAEVEELLAKKRLEAADFYLRTGRPTAAAAELRSIVREHPASVAAGEARRRLGVAPTAESNGDAGGATSVEEAGGGR
jgi:outer membrane assembly lipoprotein YfiO